MELNLYDYYGFLGKKDSAYIYCKGQKISEDFFLSSISPKKPTKTFPQYSSYIQLKSVGFLKELKKIKE